MSSEQPASLFEMFLQQQRNRRRVTGQIVATMSQWADNKDSELRRWFTTGQIVQPETPPPPPKPIDNGRKKRRR